jgi:hypothetical protein
MMAEEQLWLVYIRVETAVDQASRWMGVGWASR